MHRLSIIIIFIFSGFVSVAQLNIKVRINSLPDSHPKGSSLYIAGSFNGWNPQDEKFKFKRSTDSSYYIDLSLKKQNYEYKVTRGGWDKVECKKDGSPIDNRILNVERDTTYLVTIQGWQDRFPAKPKKNTASRNIVSIDTLLMPQLNRKRAIWIYLPDGYSNSKARYPVLYVHDGQNIFNEATAFGGEWGLDEFMNTTKLKKCIIVGIDHGGDKRLNEYNPSNNQRFGTGEGNAYVDFIAKTLKPYIDKKYRTKKRS